MDARIIKWVRANETIDLEVPINTARQSLYPIPVCRRDLSELMQYPTSKEFAYTIPIFKLSGNMEIYKVDAIVEVFCKRAMWHVTEILENTSIRFKGIPIYIMVTDATRDMIEPYRQACNFPEENIRVTKLDENNYGFITRMVQLKRLAQSGYKKIYSFDASIQYPGRWDPHIRQENNNFDIINKMINQWGNELIVALDHIGWNSYLFSYKKLIAIKNLTISEEEFYSKMAEYCELSVDELMEMIDLKAILTMGAMAAGYHSDIFLHPNFDSDVDECSKFINREEHFVGLYLYKNYNVNRLISQDLNLHNIKNIKLHWRDINLIYRYDNMVTY